MVNIGKICGFVVLVVCLLGLVVTPIQSVSAIAPLSEFTQIDGKLVSNASLEQQVVATVVLANQGSAEKQLLYGFTSLAKFHAYLAKNQHTQATPTASRSYANFFEHINVKGARLNVRLGTNVRYVGDRWNDKISSVVPVCQGKWTVMYQHRDYKGEAIAIKNTAKTCRYYFNLTDYKLSNGKNWNDRVSSIRVY